MLASLALTHAGTLEGVKDPWSFDLAAGENADWMDAIADDVLLSQLSIPGTHNSVTDRLRNVAFDYDIPNRSQNVPLLEQLASGIRYFDITCHYMAIGYLQVYDGKYDTSYFFSYVLEVMADFLDEHPRETVILRIQKSKIRTDIEAFLSYWNKFIIPDNGYRFSRRVYYKSDDTINTVPTLGEVRGKIFILQDFQTTPPGRFGLPWDSPSVSNYNPGISSTYFLGLKWADVLANIKRSSSSCSNKLCITHTTATGKAKPISVAAGTRYSAGMNRRLGQYLARSKVKCIGIIALDFPGQNLVDQIVKLNNDYRVAGPINFLPDGSSTVVAGEIDGGAVSDSEVPPAESRHNEAPPIEGSFDEAPPAEDGDDGAPSIELSDDEDDDARLLVL
ncbi:1-phosphatidylinositol phosphodiesterase [Ceratocystis lukuohia]|uniref:1-phosphatidylinositol phosphodiesterase n=1 Tax=Ceratocystis lukuohia TaxID=2019550 RepID=A0ABR4MA55_9PEZI